MLPFVVGLVLLTGPTFAARAAEEGCLAVTARHFECAWTVTWEPGSPSQQTFPLPPFRVAETHLVLTRASDAPVVGLSLDWWIDWDVCPAVSAADCLRSASGRSSGVAYTYDTENEEVGINETRGVLAPEEGPLVLALRIAEDPPRPRAFTYSARFAIDDYSGLSDAPAVGTRDDPQVRDAVGESGDPPEADIVGAWLNDPSYAEGALEVGLQLRELASRPANHDLIYYVSWSILGERYGVRFDVEPRTGVETRDSTIANVSGELVHYAGAGDASATPLMPLRVVTDKANATVTAAFPIYAIGQPRPDDELSEVRATSYKRAAAHNALPSEAESPVPSLVDEAITQVRQVRLRASAPEPSAAQDPTPAPSVVAPAPEPLATAAAAPAAWFEAPFDPANLPNTLQVAGATAAVLAFLAGLLVVRRRQDVLRRLLAEIEELEQGDVPDARARLAAIEARAHALVQKGRLDSREFQLLTRRLDQAMRAST